MKKRILSILLTLCMVLMLCPVTAFADVPLDTIVGDINGDGSVTKRDAILLQNYLEGLESFINEQLVVADFNGDGVVNYSDLTELQRSLELPESGITVTNGKATACGTEISEAAEGTRVTLTADSPPDGMDPSDAMVFDKWIVESGSNVTLADANSATTTFTMPAGPVSVTATYKPLSAGETGGLAITVNGFEVGKTPADCTYSFESTIPGVTFGKDDVTLIAWNKYVEEIGGWESIIYDDEWFEAGTRYQLVLELKGKGLSELPAVTINGKTPESCGFNTGGRRIMMDCEFGTPVAPALAVTVDGFEVGNTPNDITYSFESTIPGVEFSADDIQDIGWSKYVFYIEGYQWRPMGETEVFQAGTQYTLWLCLDNKGLELAPAVTMNGKTPEDCTIATRDSVPIQLQITCELGTPALTLNTYTVTFDSQGGSKVDSQTVSHGGTVTEPTAPTYEGYTFGGWYTEAGCTTEYDFTTAVTESLTLYAKWTLNTYTVTLHLNDGTIANGKDVTEYTYGTGATLPTADDITREGYTFEGWYDNKALTGNPVTEISDTETGNKEYWAKWETNTYTVTLNGVNSDATGAGNYAVGVTVNIYAGTKSGYSFNGWTSDNVTITNANNKNASFIMPAKDVAVTANWKKNSSGGTGHIYYTIKAIAGAGGTISPSGNAAVLYGRNKTFTITPDNGYAIADVKIDGQSIGAVKTYTFERVKGDHTIEAVFMKATDNPQTGVDVPFTDVSETDWFYEDVAYVYTNNLMNGTSTTMFSPNTTTTRGMIVTILYRLEGEPSVSDNCHFADVKSGSYYEKAITWAAAKGIVSGYGNNQFGPDDPITREQMAVILFRYAQYKGLDVSAGEDTNILSYSDALDISEYAFPAMQWICGESILNGSDGNLMPRGSATRAQVAAILHRFCENILK